MGVTKDARKHPRRNTDGMTLTCYRTKATAGYRPRKNIGEAILDISAGGCRIRLSEAVESGASVTIELRETATGDLFHAYGAVRWVDAVPGEEKSACLAGVQFQEIFTPLSKRDKFLHGRVALQARPALWDSGSKGAPAKVAPPGPAARFKVDDYTVRAFRAGLLSTVGLRKNLAVSVVDMSRTGAQLVCTEKLASGMRILFTLHLNKFADTLQTDAEVIWVREDHDGGGTPVYYTGVQFGPMAPAKQKLVDYMMSWFTSYQAKYRQEQRTSTSEERHP
ncbi:MAG: PilZ domain-containing protein [Planctomycetes bacterium]|nr:PilZ domain-containing protein [Planctomycetota bacterium]